MAPTRNELELTIYGTGLGLATVYLDDGTRVDVRRDPLPDAPWVAGANVDLPLHLLRDLLNRHPDFFLADDRTPRVERDRPEEAVSRMKEVLREYGHR